MDAPIKSSSDRFRYLEAQVLQPSRDTLVSCAVGMVWFLIGSLLFLLLAPHEWNSDWHGGLAVLGGIFAPPIVLVGLTCQRGRRRISAAINELADMDDPRVARFFLDRSGNSYWMKRGRPLLIRLLPKLQRTDAIHFPSSAQTRLHEILDSVDSDLTLAVLKALPQIGTIAALPHVELHAQGRTWFWQNAAIRHAAQECYTVLKMRADTVKEPDRTLLRASSAPISEQTLLRPALPGSEIDTAHLLRAHPSE